MGDDTRGSKLLAAELCALPDVAVAVDLESRRVLDVNQRDRPLFGYRQSDLVKLRLDDLFPRSSEFEMRRLLGGETIKLFTLRCRDMREMLVNVRVAPRLGDPRRFTVVLIREIPELAQVLDELKEANRFLDAVVENIPDMIFVK